MLFAITSGDDNLQTIGVVLMLAILGMSLFAFWLKMLLHASQSKSADKASWIIIILLTPSTLGALAYYWYVHRRVTQPSKGKTGRAKKSKSRGLFALALGLVVLAIIGTIWLAIQLTLAPISHIYEPRSLSSYTLTTAESGQFNKISYVHLIYKNSQSGQVDSIIGIHEFELRSTRFSPPENCGFSRPMNPLYGESVYGKVPCHLEKQIDAKTQLYLPDKTAEPEAANYYIVHKDTIVTITASIPVDTAIAIAQSLEDTNFSSLKQKVGSTTSSSSATCQGGPVAGSVEVDLAEPNPFADSRTDEVVRTANASHIQLRDGAIIKRDGKEYTSGKYIITVASGAEPVAIAKLKSLQYVTNASQVVTTCPTQLKVGN